MVESSSRLHALNCIRDCDHKYMAITSYGCFRELYTPHQYGELCREDHKTLKVHQKQLGKKLKKVVKAFMKRLRMCNGKEKDKRMQFQYDPKSYALNFDDGIEKCDGVFLDFSARYACPLGLNKVYLGWKHSEM